MDLSKDELTSIFENMESMDSEQISSALKLSETSVELKERLEKRYLSITRAVLENPEASLADFFSAFSTNKYLSKISEDIFYPDANKIEFVYLSVDEAAHVVNIAGAIVRNHISVDDYVNDGKATTELNDIGDSLFSKIDALKAGIDAEVQAYPAGWYGQICINMMKSMLFGVEEFVVLKSWLAKANQSPFIRDFNFFLNATSTGAFIIAQMRNIMDEGFNFSEVLWLYGQTPTIYYPSNYEYPFPKSVLPYERAINVVRFEDFYDEAGTPDLQALIDKHGIENINSNEL